VVRILFVVFVVSISATIQLVVSATPQKETPRAIISDDFTKSRPRSNRGSKSTRKGSRTYRLASTPLTKPAAKSGFEILQVGVTIWKMQRVTASHSNVRQSMREDPREQSEFITRRVEADTQFREGDLLRLSIESQRVGYLYVIDRDWFTNGTSGETNLIFPLRGEDNRLEAGKLIDIPAENRAPFKTSPKPNQAGELLTLIVASSPLPLLPRDPLSISTAQLAEWEERWSGLTERFEMIGGAGLARTLEEQQAGLSRGTRQLTRDDPGPQTIYFLTSQEQ
jgi:hypothetical protein